MDRYGFMADLVTVAADCVGNSAALGCPYEIFVSNGEPPADCSHIAAYWTNSAVLPGSQKCSVQVRESFSVSLMRCCLSMDTDFSAAVEDAEAKCFVDDFGALFECLVCRFEEALKPYVRTPTEIAIKVGNPDRSAAGGCMGGTIDISFVRFQPCC